ncbi:MULTISPECIES: hypothetical protein [Mesorhizobium]|uniref:hypothetical protein n=2 Tax=Phyllobacteriaceae TaxID=69277 RepID=UPI0007A95659|nr:MULTISPECIES: hypothetical protein [Mesorhizobium]AMX93648.1 hypothetical protein A4R28_11325 [Mesorhizobium ciceri]MDF3208339.1 hypothetical protein [Mesorhizobium sp. LMG15046]MDF3229089.1 hypothetical protein [Mesorhizobium sp. DSM 30133]RUU22199.1 hypothetical protein EOC84_03565 [Mesorhizobium sp. Primo-B]RVB90980.1 hypothetical protein EN880_08160 [Mesorhizobium sp. M7A.F.Ca.AU.002.03.1.1]
MAVTCLPIAPFGDRPVVVAAGGPSLTLSQIRRIGMARAEDKIRVIAINDAIYPCWFADILHASDKRWWNMHKGVPAFRGLKTSLEITGFHDVRTLKNTGIEGFDDTPGCIRGGCNSGYQAVHLAAQLGARRIVIVAFDFSDDGAKSHWFGPHGPGMDLHSNTENWRKHFRGLTDELARRKIAVVNATIKSTITWLPRINLDTEWS